MTGPIEDNTRQIFERALAEVLPGYLPHPDQQSYAQRAAEAFGARDPSHDEGGEITLLEAATGTGKTLGYLVPLLLNAVLTKEKAMVSTHTIALQTQLVEVDGPIACAAVERQTGIRPSIARRVGMRNFIDYGRVADLAAASRLAGLDNVVRTLAAWSAAQPDTFDAAFQDHGLSLPEGVSREDICVTPGSSLDASQAYLAHVEASHDADVVIVNHALSLIDARAWGRSITARKTAPRRLAVFDEADTLPQVAREMADRRLPVSTMEAISGEVPRGPARTALRNMIAALRLRLQDLVSSGPVIIKAADDPGLMADVGAVMSAVEAALAENEPSDEGLVEALEQLLADLVEWQEAARGDRYTVAVASPSPVSSRPALRIITVEPARLLSRLWNRQRSGQEPFLRAVVFTSATISSDGKRNWSDFMRSMGINPAWSNFCSSRSDVFEPRRFGAMEFRVADRAVPAPFKGNGQDVHYDPDWIAYVVSGISAARSAGGRVLVLTGSYADVEALEQHLDGALFHRRGQPLGPLLDAYKAASNAVLVTPAAWTGVSLPGMVQQLVIPRVPFLPGDQSRDAVREAAMVARGVDPATAAGILRAEAMADTRRKLRQGIGRGIRRADDSCTVWLLDPRFPLPPALVRNRRLRLTQGLAAHHGDLVKVIPARFKNGVNSAFDRAQIFRVPTAAAVA